VTAYRDALLDTSVVIDIERVDLAQLGIAGGAVSAVTIAELAYGLDIDDPVRRAIRIERYHATLDEFDVLPFDTAAAKLYGVLAAVVRQNGRDPRPRRLDLQIAATAASNRIPLVTRNPDDVKGLDQLVRVLAI
jgi:predicted nucleic acid-binding protein